jgi:hypothetical protein
MPTLIDLPKEDAALWFAKHIAYKNAKERDRAKTLLSFLVYTYRKLGEVLTWKMIQKEVIDDGMKRCMVLMAVKHWAAKPDYE